MYMEPLQMTPVKQAVMTAESHLGETKQPEEKIGFSDYLANALKEANALQLKSDRLNAELAAGRVDDISQVIVASEKAEIAMQLTLQVRNKALDAYQEIMRMQV